MDTKSNSILIENSHFLATIDCAGAQIISLINKKSGRELIWQRDKQYWGRCAPILFPAIGGLKNDTYTIYGKSYKMGKHGFLRDAIFTPTLHSKHKVSFSISDSAETLAQYPFHFNFTTTFKLTSYGVKQSFKIENLDDKKIYFCLGGHPAFNLPMEEGLTFEDYQIHFSKKENAPLYYLENDLLKGKKDNYLQNQNKIALKVSLFDNDALIFHRLKSKKITMQPNSLTKNSKKSFLHLGTFPMVGIWTKEGGAPYLCVEPWYGVDDAYDTDGDFTKKWEVISLEPNKKFKAWFAFGGN